MNARRVCGIATLLLVALGLALFLFGQDRASTVLWSAAALTAMVQILMDLLAADLAATRLEDAIRGAQAEEHEMGVSNPDYGKIDWRELEPILAILKGKARTPPHSLKVVAPPSSPLRDFVRGSVGIKEAGEVPLIALDDLLCTCGHIAALHTVRCDACNCPLDVQTVIRRARHQPKARRKV